MTGNISILSNQKENKVVIDESSSITVYTTEPNSNIQINDGKLVINFPTVIEKSELSYEPKDKSKNSKGYYRKKGGIKETSDKEIISEVVNKEQLEQESHKEIADEASDKDESNESHNETRERILNSLDSSNISIHDRIKRAVDVDTSKKSKKEYTSKKPVLEESVETSNELDISRFNYRDVVRNGGGKTIDGVEFKFLGATGEPSTRNAKIVVQFIEDRTIKCYTYCSFKYTGITYKGRVKRNYKVGQKVLLAGFNTESTIIDIQDGKVFFKTNGVYFGIDEEVFYSGKIPESVFELAKKHNLFVDLHKCVLDDNGDFVRLGIKRDKSDDKEKSPNFLGGTTGVTKDGYAYKVVGTKTSGDKTISVRLQFVLDRSIREVSYEDYINGIKYSDAKGVSLKTGSSLELPMFKHRCSIIREEEEKVVLSNFDMGAFTISKSDLRMGTIPEDILDSARRANALRGD